MAAYVARTVMDHILAVTMENERAALARLVDIFAARAQPIDGLDMRRIGDGTQMRVVIATKGSDATIARLCLRIGRLIDVISVQASPAATIDATIENLTQAALAS